MTPPEVTPPDRSRLALLLLPTLLLGLAGAVSAILAFGLDRDWMMPLWLLFAVSYGRMALSAASPLVGLLPERPDRVGRPGACAGPVRTALLLPVFNESPEPIAAAVRIMAESLDEADGVTVFVLSDTQDPGRLAEEALLFPFMRPRSGTSVHYRHRSPNTGRKAGNIAAFCRDHGAEYDFAIVLDADSLMTGAAIRALIDALRRDPRAALIQSVSYPVGGTTLFARLQQFGARLNTPLSVAGQHLWQGRHGTYWGHNAILRLRPFMADAGLPVLPGRPPLGGEILCHDTIEAALLLRGGSAVRLAPEIGGSFETTPSNLVDHLARERRWCQGNLQHLRLLAAPGLRAASRVHIGMGILYYLASPVGLLVSLLLLAMGVAGVSQGPHPAWAMQACLWLTLFLLFAPKLASLVRALLLPDASWRGFGGRGRLLLSVLAEQALGMLYAPIVVVSVTGFVIDTFRGRVVGWGTQARGDRPVGWAEAVRRFRVHTAVGVLVILSLGLLRPGLLPWTLPFLCGLALSIPLAVCSGSVKLGRLARRLGLFLTVDELAPLPEQVGLYSGSVPSVSPARPRPRLGQEVAAGGD